MMDAIVVWLVVGAIAGALAGRVMRGRGYGLWMDIVIGILGSLIGGWLFGTLGLYTGPEPILRLLTWIVTAFLGAILLIALIRALPGRSRL